MTTVHEPPLLGSCRKSPRTWTVTRRGQRSPPRHGHRSFELRDGVVAGAWALADWLAPTVPSRNGRPRTRRLTRRLTPSEPCGLGLRSFPTNRSLTDHRHIRRHTDKQGDRATSSVPRAAPCPTSTSSRPASSLRCHSRVRSTPPPVTRSRSMTTATPLRSLSSFGSRSGHPIIRAVIELGALHDVERVGVCHRRSAKHCCYWLSRNVWYFSPNHWINLLSIATPIIRQF